MKTVKLKKKIILYITIICVVAAFSAGITGCATADAVAAKKSFADSIEEFRLDNGIPVFVKTNNTNRLVSLALLEKGGSSLYKPEQSGLEMSLVRMLKSGSKKYSYSAIQDIKYRTHANFYGVTMSEGSCLKIDCLDYYFDEMLDVLADGVLNPVFEEEEFNTMMKEHVQRLQSMQSDPSSMAYYSAVSEIYKNHPYETVPWPTAETLENVTIDNLRKLHKSFLDARRMEIVVTGNVNSTKLLKKLNALFGSIPVLTEVLPQVEIPALDMSGENMVYSNQASAGTAFIYGFFQAPAVEAPDFLSMMIASEMYSDMLYQVVREKYGACYTPSCGITASKAGYGIINLYRVSNPENIISYVQETEKLMAQGKLISGKDENDSFIFTTIAERLESYKNIYINKTYAQQKTNSGVCSKMMNSMFMFGNPYSSDALSTQIREITADDVEKAFEKYILNGKIRYFAVTEPGKENTIKF